MEMITSSSVVLLNDVFGVFGVGFPTNMTKTVGFPTKNDDFGWFSPAKNDDTKKFKETEQVRSPSWTRAVDWWTGDWFEGTFSLFSALNPPEFSESLQVQAQKDA